MSFDASKYAKSKFLKGADLEDGPIVVTINQAYEEDFDNGTKPILGFSDLDQQLVLNKTNVVNLIKMFGEDVDAWLGQRIMLVESPTAYQGKRGVLVQRAARPKAKAAPVEVDLADEELEEIPF